MVDCLQKHVPIKQNGIKILDEASGTGAISLELAKRGYKPYATDISQDVMTQLQSKAKNQNLSIETTLADSNKTLPYADGSFSAVVSASANRYITDLDIFLNEVNGSCDKYFDVLKLKDEFLIKR